MSRSSKMIVDLLSERGMPQSELSKSTNVSYSYTNHVVGGKYLPNAGWLDLVANAMGVEERVRKELHVTAAADLVEDKGYEVDVRKMQAKIDEYERVLAENGLEKYVVRD